MEVGKNQLSPLIYGFVLLEFQFWRLLTEVVVVVEGRGALCSRVYERREVSWTEPNGRVGAQPCLKCLWVMNVLLLS